MTPYTFSLAATIFTQEQLSASPLRLQPQVGMAGRSNVGKSSLINALSGRRQLAKVSSTPGKTASINFYRLEPLNFYLADLPGYGYARRSKRERRHWGELLQNYLHKAPSLAALILLLDCRLEPQDSDLDLLAFARSLEISIIPALTKADKCSQSTRAARQKQWRELLAGKSLLITSAAAKNSERMGIEELRETILSLAAASAQGPGHAEF
jgi:GTP-binding protein